MPFPDDMTDAAVDGSTKWTAQRLNDIRNIIVGPMHYNVCSAKYGADPSGVNDSTTAIQSALNDARLGGGGIVFIPKGTYKLSFQSPFGPLVAEIKKICLAIGNNTTLMGTGRGASVLQLQNSEPLGNDNDSSFGHSMICNYEVTNGGPNSDRIAYQDLTLDGNAANQTHTCYGFDTLRGQDIRYLRVVSKNVRGTATSGVNETAQFVNGLSTNVSYTDCEAIGDAGSTALGFGSSSSQNGKYENCVSRGMTVSNGFTANTCNNMLYSNCHAHNNASYGFNAEVGENIRYSNCIAGSRAIAAATCYPYNTNASLGNTLSGFTVNASLGVELSNCVSRKNGTYGLWVVGAAATTCRVIGGAYTDNSQYGMVFGTATDAQNTRVTGGPLLSGNTTNQCLQTATAYAAFGVPALQPAVPASTVTQTNPYGFDAVVYIKGGTLTVINVGGGATGISAAAPAGAVHSVKVAAGQTIAITYSVVPTWVWAID